ncbi:phosphoenolpyruvate synthase [Croceicoccus ponticola]|nr:phosphoenolpyruvate synthase [Croceicoccus ponticola]
MVIPFADLTMDDIALVGGKNASLGVLTRELAPSGVPVPPGFALTTRAFRSFVAENGLEPQIRGALQSLAAQKLTLEQVGETIRAAILSAPMPATIAACLTDSYRELARQLGQRRPAVAVRSSATAEDLPGASFAGQLQSFLNVRGADALIAASRRCFASLFTDRAIAYREAKGFDQLAVAVSVGVQQMVRSDRAGSGVMFTIDTESGFPDVVMISAAWGLGETVVQGQVEPDRYMVFKPLLERHGVQPIIGRDCGHKSVRLVYGRGEEEPTRLLRTSRRLRERLVLTDDEVLRLARWAVAIELHYGGAMDIEWAKDGPDGDLFIVQARPETVQSGRSRAMLRRYTLQAEAKPVLSGAAVGTAIATGKACVIGSVADLDRFPDGAILVAANTDPDWVPVMKRAAGIVTDHGGTTSHAAIVSRELGVPAVVGTGHATTKIANGEPITLSCASGDRGHVYDVALPFTCEDIDVGTLPVTRTQVMVNTADPGAAFAWWQLPAKGVGLARMEFIIANLVRAHPMALLHPERVSEADRRTIARLTRGHADGRAYFVDTLARGIARLATPWYPHPAIVRLSDFKTNEYARLIGGKNFEPVEENPMIGFRGASRYCDERYREGFAMECEALARVRNDMGFDNVVVMVPFCRTPDEADRVLAEMAANGLCRGKNGLHVYMMCEIPANVVLADDFAQRFDGFSIGSNDLTQLMLGVDRDSEILAPLFDERNPAVTRSIADVIVRAHANGIKVGICGQAPSNHADFAAFLVREGIDSISLDPDSFVRTIHSIAETESRLAKTAPDRRSGRPVKARQAAE